jgi:ER-bound oxygenase mpaB/B'/Rubber oxygenase, catalytic domain
LEDASFNPSSKVDLMPSLVSAYPKRFGVLRNRQVARDIAKLDPQADCEQIVHLLASYEFGFDIARVLELALFHTYGSVSVSKLLDGTQEFAKHGQKRYDDTRLLISHFLEDGFKSDYGQRAIARMNGIHGSFRIPNDDYVFVLSTFITYPIDWVEQYGYRPMTDGEKLAWFHFFREVGKLMGMKELPETLSALRAWVSRYEQRELIFAPANRRVADATVAIFEGWYPLGLKWTVKPVVRALIRDDLREAFGYAPAPDALKLILPHILTLRASIKKYLHIERTPRSILNTRNRTYPGNQYTIEGIKPSYDK